MFVSKVQINSFSLINKIVVGKYILSVIGKILNIINFVASKLIPTF